MRPNDTIFLGQQLLPGWLQALVRQLPTGGAQAPPTPFAVVPLLQELSAICDGVALGKEPPFTQDRKSLNEDVQRALAGLGPEAAATGRTAIVDFRRNDIRTLLKQPAGANRLRSAAHVLLRDLSAPSGRAASWRDCVHAFETGAEAGECESRLRHLSTLFEAAGFDWPERAKEISGEITLSVLLAHRGSDPASVTIADRLATAEEVVREEIAPSADAVVWIVFADAAIRRLHVRKGQIDFYDSRIWNAVLSGTWLGNPTWTQPAELADPQATSHLDGLPPSDFVMVRVALENVPHAEARERARDLALSVVELAGAERDSEWMLLNGAAAYTTEWWGSVGFMDPRDPPVTTPPLMSPVADGIDDVDDGFVRRLAAADLDVREMVADRRWFRSAGHLNNAEQRLALYVSLIERLLVPAAVRGDKWYGASEHYFEYLLAFDAIRDTAWDTIYYGVNRTRRLHPIPSQLQQLAQSLVTVSGNRIDVDLPEGIRQASALHSYVDEGSIEERMLAELEQRTANGKAASEWIEAGRQDAIRLLARALRQRNAATHGTRTIPAVVASVEPFLSRLVGRLLNAHQYCVEQKLDLTTELEGWRLLRLQRCDDLLSGGAPDALLII